MCCCTTNISMIHVKCAQSLIHALSISRPNTILYVQAIKSSYQCHVVCTTLTLSWRLWLKIHWTGWREKFIWLAFDGMKQKNSDFLNIIIIIINCIYYLLCRFWFSSTHTTYDLSSSLWILCSLCSSVHFRKKECGMG